FERRYVPAGYGRDPAARVAAGAFFRAPVPDQIPARSDGRRSVPAERNGRALLGRLDRSNEQGMEGSPFQTSQTDALVGVCGPQAASQDPSVRIEQADFDVAVNFE